MDRINQNRINNTQFKGVPKVNETEAAQTMEELIKKMVENVRNTLVKTNRVPDYGDFSILQEKFKNIDKNLCVDEFWLEVMLPPSGIENYKKIRGLKYCASKPNSDIAMEILLASGSKQDIIEQLKEPALLDELKQLSKKLSDSLRDL